MTFDFGRKKADASDVEGKKPKKEKSKDSSASSNQNNSEGKGGEKKPRNESRPPSAEKKKATIADDADAKIHEKLKAGEDSGAEGREKKGAASPLGNLFGGGGGTASKQGDERQTKSLRGRSERERVFCFGLSREDPCSLLERRAKQCGFERFPFHGATVEGKLSWQEACVF